ncbi:amino acid ABC transporter substrate-binding protein [Clostridia bacterium]|nr:amino acid ABC transporter substrate-binding protein [Clostridia bacterium]
MKRTALILAIVLIFGAFAVGCGTTEPAASTSPEVSPSSEVSPSTLPSEAPEPPAQTGELEQTTFTVGFDNSFPPMGFVDDDGNNVGFDLDLAAEVAKRLNLELKLQPIAWDSKNMELDAGNIDCVWNGFTITGRESDYEWTAPYMNNRQVIVVKGDSAYVGPSELMGKSLALQKDSSAQAALDKNAAFKNDITPVYVDDYLGAFMNLETGAVEGVLVDEIVARYHIEKQQANFKILDDALASEEYGVGFKKGNTLLRDKVAAALEEMAKDGSMAAISEKWFGSDITTIGK